MEQLLLISVFFHPSHFSFHPSDSCLLNSVSYFPLSPFPLLLILHAPDTKTIALIFIGTANTSALVEHVTVPCSGYTGCADELSRRPPVTVPTVEVVVSTTEIRVTTRKR